MASFDVNDLIRRFDGPGVIAIGLVGSYARGDAGPFSDIDLVRLVAAAADVTGRGSHLTAGRLVNVSDAPPDQIERWFTEPELAVNVVAGLRQAQPLVDREGSFAAVQARARAFVWDAAMQARADRWASQQMVGWIEEAYKGMEGLRRSDLGRLLNAEFGLSWGLGRVVAVQRGVLLTSDNDHFAAIEAAVGSDTRWARLRRIAFGVEDYGRTPPTLRERVIAGLRLYCVTADLIHDAIQPDHAPLIAHAVSVIDRELGPLPIGV